MSASTDNEAYRMAYAEYLAARDAYLRALDSAQSASIGSGTGSKSYTNYDLSKLKAAMNAAVEKCYRIKSSTSASMPRSVSVRFE